MRWRAVASRCACTFQSAPDREAGRCDGLSESMSAYPSFQSAPDREAGRCAQQGEQIKALKGFNPRPTVRPGDAKFRRALYEKYPVSIRARP